MKAVAEILFFILIGLLVYGGVIHFIHYQRYLSDFELLFPFVKKAVYYAWLLPAMALISGILIAIPPTRFYGLLSGFLLLSVMTIYIGVVRISGIKTACGCDAGSLALSGNWQLSFLCFCLGTVIFLIWHYYYDRIDDRHRPTH